MEINFVCSLGTICHTAMCVQRLQWKVTSYPFDWIFTDEKIVKHCLMDDFKTFLNPLYYIDYPIPCTDKCGHSLYHPIMFNHRNPKNEKDYQYYQRCVQRFRDTLSNPLPKLFILGYYNINNFCLEEHIQKAYECRVELSTHTNNYTLLVILNIVGNSQNHYLYVLQNILFLELHTLSKSGGVSFLEESDNMYLENLLKKLFVFQNKFPIENVPDEHFYSV
jgi:hypothetical protein